MSPSRRVSFHKGLTPSHWVLATQTRRAQQLDRCPNLYEAYITELLTLFVDKGVAVQTVAVSAHSAKVCRRISWSSLLIDAWTRRRKQSNSLPPSCYPQRPFSTIRIAIFTRSRLLNLSVCLGAYGSCPRCSTLRCSRRRIRSR